MDEAPRDEAAVSSFLEDVEKEILEEAPADAWHHPRPGDIVTVEIEGDGGATAATTRTWAVGAAAGFAVAGVDLDRCVSTMRRSESATFRARGDEAATPAHLRLLGLERAEDLLGDGRLVRTTVQDGAGWQTPQAGTEIRVRFAWRVLPSGGVPQAEEAAETAVLLGGAEQRASSSREMADLRRALLQRFGGAVVVRSDPSATAKGPLLRVVHRDDILAEYPEGVQVAQAHAALEAKLRLPGASDRALPQREAREVAMSVEEGRCVCSAEDWIPGAVGLRVLADLRAGQRCLVRVAPELAFGPTGPPPDIVVPSDQTLEYDIELLQIMTLEDVSLDGGSGVMKKTMREGDGYDRPADGAEAVVRVEARDDASGAVLMEEREVTFGVGAGRFCSALEETVLTMKKGETCEVRCTDLSACIDAELGLKPGPGLVVVLCLELLSFEKIDLYSTDEAARVAYCADRKEAGTRFFQDGSWRRALKRYQHVTSTLAYLDHWKDEAAKAEAAALRRAGHLNTAACCLKLEAWRQAETSCHAVLKEEPENVKALFRRGQALKELGEYRDAEQSFRKVIEIDKDNKEAGRMLVKLRQFVKAEVEQQKEMLSRMARGIKEKAPATVAEAAPSGAQAAPEAAAARTPSANADASLAGSWAPWGVAALLVCSSVGLALLARGRWRK